MQVTEADTYLDIACQLKQTRTEPLAITPAAMRTQKVAAPSSPSVQPGKHAKEASRGHPARQRSLPNGSAGTPPQAEPGLAPRSPLLPWAGKERRAAGHRHKRRLAEPAETFPAPAALGQATTAICSTHHRNLSRTPYNNYVQVKMKSRMRSS